MLQKAPSVAVTHFFPYTPFLLRPGRARTSTAPHRLLSAPVLKFVVDSVGVEAATTATAPLGELPPRPFFPDVVGARADHRRSPRVTTIIGTPSLLRRRTASPVTDFPGEPHPLSPCPTCSPLLTRARTTLVAAPHLLVRRCELHRRADCTQRAPRAHTRPARPVVPQARPTVDAAGRGK
jgi:hypothetical protein